MEAFWVYIILKMLYMAGCTIGLSGTKEARPSSLVRIRHGNEFLRVSATNPIE